MKQIKIDLLSAYYVQGILPHNVDTVNQTYKISALNSWHSTGGDKYYKVRKRLSIADNMC